MNSQPPNDLYDQRDHLIAKLNEVVGITTTHSENGSLNVFFGNGQQLVVGTTASELTTMMSSSDPNRMVVGIVNAAGAQELPESLISGGAISGLLRYRSETLDMAANTLGQIAVSMALTFNAQHALGQDLLGQINDGASNFVPDFFKITDPGVVGNANNPDQAMVTAQYMPPEYNSAEGTFYTKLTNNDYQLNYTAGTATLTRIPDGKQWTAAAIAGLSTLVESEEGFSISDGGLGAGPYSFLIQPTRNAAGRLTVNPAIAADVRQIAAGTPILATVVNGNTGTASISSGSVQPVYPMVTPPAYATAAYPLTLTYSGGMISWPSGSMTISVDGVTYGPSAGPATYINGATYTTDTGISFTISGNPKDGDQFEIRRNDNGVSDNRNALLLGKMQTGKTVAGNTATFSTRYSQMVSSVGNKGNEVNTILLSQQTVLRETIAARDELSGVNLDEEAANLLRYQQAYQASAKMLQIASSLFDSILAIR